MAIRYPTPLFLLACCLALGGCSREERDIHPAAPNRAILTSETPESQLQPGGKVMTGDQRANPYENNAYAINEGQRLFNWYNCSGCHANGGGGIGPALIDNYWIYGNSPANIFDTIAKGRPNGMPAWGGRIPENQIWQLVAYVRSLGGLQSKLATPARADHMYPRSDSLSAGVGQPMSVKQPAGAQMPAAAEPSNGAQPKGTEPKKK